MGQHAADGQDPMEQWVAVPPFLKGLLYGFTAVVILALIVLIVAGIIWLVGSPIHPCK
jgi:hypothetical protein